jgi:hypothetical protein
VADTAGGDVMGLEPVYSLSIEKYLTSCRRNHTRNRLERCGLPGAVSTYQGSNLAFANTEGHTPEDLDIAVAGGQVNYLEKLSLFQIRLRGMNRI